MTLWKTLRGGSTDNPVCAPVPMPRAEGPEEVQPIAASPQIGTGIPACPPAPRARIAAVLFATALFATAAAPAHAQIRKLVEENGRIVFVNADENNPVRATKGKSANTNSALASASRAGSAAPVDSDPRGFHVLSRAEIDKYVEELAAKHNVDPELIRAVIAAESGYNPAATSRKGAQGLMQLMPGTAQQLGVRDAYNAKQNLDAGVRYLRALLDKYNGDLDKALAAYNAGEGAVARAGGVPNIRETQNYIRRITDQYYHSDPNGPHGWMPAPRTIRREVDASGKVVFTNE
jgi:soluble lytic murein transglycosylase-like protein